MSEPRYIVRESVGVPVAFAFGIGKQKITEIMIMDSWYGYEVAWSSLHFTGHRTRARATAHRLCRQWNAEHDAFMLEDAQARKGTVSC